MPVEKVKMKVRVSDANLFHVPQKKWREWTEIARRVFNEVYSGMNGNQELFLHPKAEKAPRTAWKTTSWNAAWTAADAVMAQLRVMANGK